MKWIFGPPLFHLLLCCATQTFGVRIDSVPVFNDDGVIKTELENTVSLVCLSDGGHESEEELVWLRNNAAVSLQEGNMKGSSKVCVKPVHEDNGATFTCQLKNNATISASVSLDVTFPPQLSGSEEVTLEEEDVLVLSCDIWANPQITSVSWTLNGSIVNIFGGGFTLTNDGSTGQLSTISVDRSLHQGTYQCSVNSTMYGQFSKSFFVTVTDKTVKFPLMPIIAGLVVVFLTALLAIASRWSKIRQCCK